MDFRLSDEQRLFRQTVRQFAETELRPRAAEVDRTGEFNWDAAKKMGPLGLLGLNTPEEYGGPGVDTVGAAIALEELAWGCGSTALSIAAHNGLCCASLALFANHDQKEQLLRPLSTGAGKLGALALTEPAAGSDLSGGVTTTAVEEGDSWIIDGQKMWTTNASIADIIVVLARTDRQGNTHSLSQFIVPTATPGIEVGPPERKMGLHGSPTHAVTFREVRVPRANLLGTAGQGLQQTLTVLDGGRIGIAALCVGLAQGAYDEALRYAQERHAFGKPISQHEAIGNMLADMATDLEAARLMVYRAAWTKAQGLPFTQPAAMAKLFASEVSERVCHKAIQIHGGYGYSAEFPVERMYRDQRLMAIGEGTSEVQRMVIARKALET